MNSFDHYRAESRDVKNVGVPLETSLDLIFSLTHAFLEVLNALGVKIDSKHAYE